MQDSVELLLRKVRNSVALLLHWLRCVAQSITSLDNYGCKECIFKYKERESAGTKEFVNSICTSVRTDCNIWTNGMS